jgi:lysophospholipid acyltransferase (LPLAT)-like uncharacterized protein
VDNLDRIEWTASSGFGGQLGPDYALVRKVETEIIYLAQKTDELILPVTISGTRLFSFPRTWDQTILPMPFSKVIADFAQPIEIPSTPLQFQEIYSND